MNTVPPTDVLIIGAGITGLSLAHQLKQSGLTVKVVESSHKIGGAIQSSFQDGFLNEAGPNSILVKSKTVSDFINWVMPKDRIVCANPLAAKRFLIKKGKVTAVPHSAISAVTTPLYSFPAKLRLLIEPFIKKSPLLDESISSFVSRRMGTAFLEYGIAPMVSGIFAGNPDSLSIRHAFPKVWNLEQNYGSLIGGSIKLKKDRKGTVPFKSTMISFQNGLGELPAQLASEIGCELLLNSEITKIEKNSDGIWLVTLGGTTYTCKHIVSTIPIHGVQNLPFDNKIKTTIGAINTPNHPPVSTLMLGYKKEDIQHPLDGFGVLAPRRENRKILGVIFSSSLFPNRAPEGMVNLMVFIGGSMQPEYGCLSTGELINLVKEELADLLNINGEPICHRHHFWPQAIPQYQVGYDNFLNQIQEVESTHENLHLIGNFRGGPGVNDCIQSALDLAKTLTEATKH